jgi:hypothetical protein
MLKKLTLLILLLTLSIPLSFADTEITHTLTATDLNLTTAYNDEQDPLLLDGAEYTYIACKPSSTSTQIQFNSKSHKSGIILTKSPGTIKEIEISFSSCATETVVYGSKTPYTSLEAVYSAEASARGAELGKTSEAKTLTISDLTGGGGTRTSPS